MVNIADVLEMASSNARHQSFIGCIMKIFCFLTHSIVAGVL